MNNTPLVSVVVPIYNTEQYLSRCIESICNQTYQNLEIILVDDGSPDGAAQICEDYALKDRRIKVIHKENGGLSSARNAGLDAISQNCEGYISFVDSDDYIEVDMYEKMVDASVKNDADVCLCRGITIDEYSQYGTCSISSGKENVILSGDELLDLLVKDGSAKYVVVWNKLIKRQVFANLRFMVGKQHEDEYIIHYIYGLSKKVILIDDVLYNYQLRSSSIMHEAINVNRFDAVDALIDRTEFFIARNNNEFAALTLVKAIDVIVNLYGQIIRPSDVVKRRVYKQQKTIKQEYKRIRGKHLSIKNQLKIFLGIYAMPLYKQFQRIKMCR